MNHISYTVQRSDCDYYAKETLGQKNNHGVSSWFFSIGNDQHELSAISFSLLNVL